MQDSKGNFKASLTQLIFKDADKVKGGLHHEQNQKRAIRERMKKRQHSTLK